MTTAPTIEPTMAVGEMVMASEIRCGRMTAPASPTSAPSTPPVRPSSEASRRNCCRITRGGGAERLAQADLADPLDNRDQHDVHDPDTPDEQGDRGDPGEQHGKRLVHRGGGGQ